MYKLCNGKVLFFLRSLYFVCTYDDPLFSFAYYCKTVLVNYFGAVNDKLRGLVQYSWYIYRLTTKHIYLFIRVIYTFIVLVSSLCTYLILPFISPKKKMYLFIVLLSSTCTVYIYASSSVFFLFLYMRNSRVTLSLSLSIYRH